MTDVLIPLGGVGAVVLVVGALWRLADRVRRRGGGGDVLGPFDEPCHPAAHRTRINR